jgi:clan AA aspartic protease (TIGR02281 family)
LSSLLAFLVLLGASGRPGLAALAVLLPATFLAAGLHSRLGRPLLSAGCGMLVWGALVWLGSPAWVARRAALIEAGASEAQADWLDARLPGVSPRAVVASTCPPCDPPVVQVSTERVASAVTVLGEEDLVVLPYEGTRSSMRLPVLLELDNREAEIELIFDTGATLTALNPDQIDALGHRVPDTAPQITLQTANGRRQAALILLDRIWLGGFPVENVTASVCEGCGSLGLLGLNVSGNFRVEVDQGAQELIFRPEVRPDRLLDVKHWLSIQYGLLDGLIRLQVLNKAPALVESVSIELRCGSEAETVQLSALEPGEQRQQDVPVGFSCNNLDITLLSAHW